MVCLLFGYCSALITHRLKMLTVDVFPPQAFQACIVHSVCGCSYRINISQFILYLTPNEEEKL
jgi:hypothetical protein